MLLILGAIVIGLVLGFLMRGSLRNLGETRFRLWPLAILGLALQVVPTPPSGPNRWVGPALLVASYVVLLVFVGANIRLVGFPLIAAGFVMNALVIGVNGGMPVKEEAMREAAGPYFEQTYRRLTREGGAKHHLARPDDDLMFLADVIPLGAPIRQVVSAGDLAWLAGTVLVIAGAMRPKPKHAEGAAAVERAT